MNAARLFSLLFLMVLVTACSPTEIEAMSIPSYTLERSPIAEQLNTVTLPAIPPIPTLPVQAGTPARSPLPIFKTTAVQPYPGTTQPQGVVDKAIDDLANRLGVSRDAIQVVEVTFTELTPDDLQCIPRNSGIQVPLIVFGYEIILQAEGEMYRYLGHNQQVVYCPRDF